MGHNGPPDIGGQVEAPIRLKNGPVLFERLKIYDMCDVYVCIPIQCKGMICTVAVLAQAINLVWYSNPSHMPADITLMSAPPVPLEPWPLPAPPPFVPVWTVTITV